MTQTPILLTKKYDYATSPGDKIYKLTFTLADPALRDLVTPVEAQGVIGNQTDGPNGIFENYQAMITYYYQDSAENLMTQLNGAQSYEPFTYAEDPLTVDEPIHLAKQNQADVLQQIVDNFPLLQAGPMEFLAQPDANYMKSMLAITPNDIDGLDAHFIVVEGSIEDLAARVTALE